MGKITTSARWIWTRDNISPDNRVIFRKKFSLADLPADCPAVLAVDTKYWLYLNGHEVVFEGGLFRESRPGCGYADVVDLAPWLIPGENTLALLCWFYGNGGRNNTDSTRAGLLFDCPTLGLQSDASFLCLRHPAYIPTEGRQPSFLYGGHNTGFDANRDVGDFSSPDFDDSAFAPATEYPNVVWGELYRRPIPLHRVSEKRIFDKVSCEDGKYVAALPCAAQVTPGFIVEARGGEVIHVYSDRYGTPGGPGDETNTYYGHRTDYICKPGRNQFSSLFYVFGEALIFEPSEPVKFIEFSYRESGYDCDLVGEFTCDDEVINRAFRKAVRTLYVCMRDNFMDCPDRERGQWVGDVSVQMPQVGYVLSDSALCLARKCICDFIQLRKSDVLVGNVPGQHFSELPSQSLNAISDVGMIATYFRYTQDKDILALCFDPCISYLKLWEMGDDGLLLPRQGNWRWMDHLFNVDQDVCENAWYYSALTFMQKIADRLDDHRHDDFISSRMVSLRDGFERKFWRGAHYASGDFVDDRANALAVLAGLCPEARYPLIRKVLITVFNSTVYMENYVLSALCEMGYLSDAYHRMASRYYNLAMNDNSTLWEDFYILGTKNHAWSGAPVTIACKYFMGIRTDDGFETLTVRPDKALFRRMSCTVHAKGGTVHITVDNETGEVSVVNSSGTKVSVIY